MKAWGYAQTIEKLQIPYIKAETDTRKHIFGFFGYFEDQEVVLQGPFGQQEVISYESNGACKFSEKVPEFFKLCVYIVER